MKLLLDTHVFLWFITANERLKEPMVSAIRDPANEVFLSVVSIWEATIKHRLGKLPLPEPPEAFLPGQRIRHKIKSLPLLEGSIRHMGTLPDLHRDPFDRMLICQAIDSGMTIVTVDEFIRSYPVGAL